MKCYPFHIVLAQCIAKLSQFKYAYGFWFQAKHEEHKEKKEKKEKRIRTGRKTRKRRRRIEVKNIETRKTRKRSTRAKKKNTGIRKRIKRTRARTKIKVASRKNRLFLGNLRKEVARTSILKGTTNLAISRMKRNVLPYCTAKMERSLHRAPSQATNEARFVQELNRWIRDDETGGGSQLLQKVADVDKRDRQQILA